MPESCGVACAEAQEHVVNASHRYLPPMQVPPHRPKTRCAAFALYLGLLFFLIAYQGYKVIQIIMQPPSSQPLEYALSADWGELPDLQIGTGDAKPFFVAMRAYEGASGPTVWPLNDDWCPVTEWRWVPDSDGSAWFRFQFSHDLPDGASISHVAELLAKGMSIDLMIWAQIGVANKKYDGEEVDWSVDYIDKGGDDLLDKEGDDENYSSWTRHTLSYGQGPPSDMSKRIELRLSKRRTSKDMWWGFGLKSTITTLDATVNNLEVGSVLPPFRRCGMPHFNNSCRVVIHDSMLHLCQIGALPNVARYVVTLSLHDDLTVTEVHKVSIAQQLTSSMASAGGLFPWVGLIFGFCFAPTKRAPPDELGSALPFFKGLDSSQYSSDSEG